MTHQPSGLAVTTIAKLLEAWVRMLGTGDLEAGQEMQLLEHGLIEVGPKGIIHVTERGACFCAAIRALPLPIQTGWTMP